MSQSENVTTLRRVAYFVFLLSKLFQKLQLQSCLAVLTACGVFCKSSSRRASVCHGLLTSPAGLSPRSKMAVCWPCSFRRPRGMEIRPGRQSLVCSTVIRSRKCHSHRIIVVSEAATLRFHFAVKIMDLECPHEMGLRQ